MGRSWWGIRRNGARWTIFDRGWWGNRGDGTRLVSVWQSRGGPRYRFLALPRTATAAARSGDTWGMLKLNLRSCSLSLLFQELRRPNEFFVSLERFSKNSFLLFGGRGRYARGVPWRHRAHRATARNKVISKEFDKVGGKQSNHTTVAT